jgi:hypothetical protein
LDNNHTYIQLPIGFKEFILNKALEELDSIKNKELTDIINKLLKISNLIL